MDTQTAGKIKPVPDHADDRATNVVATPEGDNEMLPDEPLEPSSDAAVAGLQTPRGSEPDAYRRDQSGKKADA